MAVPSANTIVLFMLSALALHLSPGPSILFILSRCMAEGRRAAIVSVFGLATASVVQALAAAFGLANGSSQGFSGLATGANTSCRVHLEREPKQGHKIPCR